jgi:hypothetical protein
MKSILGLVTVLVVIGAVYYFFENYLPRNPLGEDDAYKVDITTYPAEHDSTMRISNNTNMDLRLHVFFASDRARGIAKYNDVVKRGNSIEYPRDSYDINIWWSKLFDEQLQWTGERWTDVNISGTKGNLRISGTAKPPVRITNTVDEQLKVCAYKVEDTVRAIPLVPCWDLGKDRTVAWTGAPAMFTVKVFDPALLDVALVTQSHVPHLSTLVIRKEGMF